MPHFADRSRSAALFLALGTLSGMYAGHASQQPSGMQMPGMDMPMPGKDSAAVVTGQAYTDNRRFLVKLRSVPSPIPFEQYFTLQFAVYDAGHPDKALMDAHLDVAAGMQHGRKDGFAHGMQSAPRVIGNNGVFTVSGMYFHMAGTWTVKVDVSRNGQKDTAYFTLPCCGH